MYDIALFAYATARDVDTYSNLLVTVTSLMLDIVIANKNLIEELKDNTCLGRVLF